MKIPNHKTLSSIIQWGISLFAIIYIIWRLIHFEDWEVFFSTLYYQRWQLSGVILIQLTLSILNIAIEIAKWHQLSNSIINQSWHNTIYQVLKGIQTGMITPARSGDPVTRGLLLPKGLKTKGFILSATGSVIQNIVLLAGGLTGILLTKSHTLQNNVTFYYLQKGILDYSLVIIIAIVLIIIPLYTLTTIFKNHRLIIQIRAHLQAISQLGKKRILKITSLTIARYSVYNFQLWILLYFLSVSNSMADLGLIMIYFAAITLLPSMAIADLGIRSSIALFLFGMLSANSAGIVISIFLIWLINLALPSIIAATIHPKDDAINIK